jgi:hypothetical protein
MIAVLFLAFSICAGFTEHQQAILRRQFIDHRAPQMSAIVDALLPLEYAFTDQQELLCHIDGLRFQCCPNSLANVAAHEIHHLNGRQHNVAYVKDDPMSYAITITPDGTIVEDKFLLPPLSPTQSWASQIILPPSPSVALRPMPATVPVRHKYLPLPVRIVSLNESSADADPPRGA